jgi:murein peptide amidase A
MRTRTVACLLAVPVVIAAGMGIAEASEPGDDERAVAEHTFARHALAPVRIPLVHRVTLGRSVRGRPIYAFELGDSRSPRKAVVVGCIHGNERAGVAVVNRIVADTPKRAVDLWLIPTLNPDGEAAGTRQNAHGVDLNRNFPWRWRPLGPPGTQQYAGPRALSEPESRIAHALIARLRPAVTIWFHQPLGVVDESGGSLAVERRFAHLAALPLRRLTRYPGSAASWQDHSFQNTSAFVVELPGGHPTPAMQLRWARAVLQAAAGSP